MNQSVYPCLWFENNANEAANFYCKVFRNAKIISSNPIVTMFSVNDSLIMALNGKVNFKFNESISLVVNCDTQDEIDDYWNALTDDGGKESMCGWLKDKYGVSWQIVPSILGDLVNDPVRGSRVIEAFMKMKKFDIQTLLQA
jgi:predicted 3-demethylubiquinone-9 3-methyltransferase (glyoxalase superfamily)